MFKCRGAPHHHVSGPLFRLLEKRTGSTSGAIAAQEDVAYLLGRRGAGSPDEKLAGLALCSRGENVELVSRHLSWRDFEGFCTEVLRSKGYVVRENVVLRRPRAQVDVYAMSDSLSLAIDCKHWARVPGYLTLARLIEAQKARARRLRDTLDRAGPIAPVIVLVADGGARFVDGGAVVPIYALGDFLSNVEAFREMLDFV